jgi:uncharacterized protein
VKQVLSMVAVLVITGTAQAAGFDCAKATNAAEHMVCNTPALSKMDSELGALYSQQLRIVKDKKALQSEQHRWIRKVRDACADVECLNAAYQRRTYAMRFGSAWLTAERANAICQNVLAAANDGSLARRFTSFDPLNPSDEEANRYLRRADLPDTYHINDILRFEQHGRTRTLGRVLGGGTCSACEIVDLLAEVQQDALPEDDEQEHLRWASWGTCDNLLFVEGEPILVKTQNHSRSSIALVSWIGPDGATRPLCGLAPMEDEFTAVTLLSRNKKLCETVAKNRLDAVPWKPGEGVTPEERTLFERFDKKSSAEIDLNMDGRVDRIQLFDYASGAGCGHYNQWLYAAPSGGDRSDTVALQESLRELRGPLEGAWSAQSMYTGAGAIRLFRYEGKPYVLARGEARREESGNALYSTWNNRRETWCEYRYVPKHTIRLIYPPESWPVPTPMPDGHPK